VFWVPLCEICSAKKVIKKSRTRIITDEHGEATGRIGEINVSINDGQRPFIITRPLLSFLIVFQVRSKALDYEEGQRLYAKTSHHEVHEGHEESQEQMHTDRKD